MSSVFDRVFSNLPDELKDALNKHFHEIKQNYSFQRYEPSELNGGKFSEIVLKILEWHTEGGKYTPLGQRYKNFNQVTRNFETKTSYNDSIRFHIPQALNVLYGIRNKRGVAHHAGEIDSNHMDATLVVAVTDWIMAELVRIFHNISIKEAQDLVESLTVKQIPVVWQIGDNLRVITPPGKKLQTREKILILLYEAYPKPITVMNLLKWTEYDPKNRGRFRNSILKELHKQDLIHLDQTTDETHISRIGLGFVESNLPINLHI